MTGLHEWIVAQRQRSCAWCGVAVFIALTALCLGLVHIAGGV